MLVFLGSASACSDADDDADRQQIADDSASPLADYLGFPPGVLDASSGGTANPRSQTDQQVEQAVADCMAEAGFVYVPEVAAPIDARQQADGIDPDSSEWIATYGFGISTLAFPQSKVGEELVGYTMVDQTRAGSSDGAAASETGDATGDTALPGQIANEAYLDGLSADDQTAYLDALYGLGLGADGERDEPGAADDTPGCFEAAVAGINVATRVDFFVEFADDLALASQDIDLYPAVVTYRQEVLACLVEADETIEPDLDAVSVIRDRLILELANVFAVLGETDLGDDPQATELALAELATLQTEELRLAQLVDRCDGEPGDEEALIAEARADVERDFIERNKGRLDAFLQARETDGE